METYERGSILSSYDCVSVFQWTCVSELWSSQFLVSISLTLPLAGQDDSITQERSDSSGSNVKLPFKAGCVFLVLPTSFLGGSRSHPLSSPPDPPAPCTHDGFWPVSPPWCVGLVLASSKHTSLEAMLLSGGSLFRKFLLWGIFQLHDYVIQRCFS